ncbi:MAG: hypothetical protein GKR93_04340 [Gammaproteobacteria bacterium]|nr:hypothetical protein [Gammaproteobacteria bacterium]
MLLKLTSWQAFNKERSIKSVPALVSALLLLAITSQLTWHYHLPAPEAKASSMSLPPSQEVLQLMSLGDSVAFAKLMMLNLQAFDNQPGLSIPFKNLDYIKVVAWLERVARLDPLSQYPYLTAARVYAEVQDDDKRVLMLNFVRQGFLKDPERQWPAMAHAVFVAKHRIKDLDLALRYARDIRVHLKQSAVPSWVRQMELFVLEDLGDLESAQILLGGFLESGIIKDEKEYRFLKERLGVEESESH